MQRLLYFLSAYLCIFVCCVLLSACGDTMTPTPVVIVKEVIITATPAPTNTPNPTSTFKPTSELTAIPTIQAVTEMASSNSPAYCGSHMPFPNPQGNEGTINAEYYLSCRGELKDSSEDDICNIKGNITTTGEKIFHIKFLSDSYFDTGINPTKGERWFCTEQHAIDNGWRKSKT